LIKEKQFDETLNKLMNQINLFINNLDAEGDAGDSFKLLEEVLHDDKPRTIPEGDPDFAKTLKDLKTPSSDPMDRNFNHGHTSNSLSSHSQMDPTMISQKSMDQHKMIVLEPGDPSRSSNGSQLSSLSVQSEDDAGDSFKLLQEVFREDKPRTIPANDPGFVKILNDLTTPPSDLMHRDQRN